MNKRIPNCKCKICEKEMYRRPAQIKSGNIFCSQKCYGQDCLVLISCSFCGKLFKSGLNKKTCDHSCANKLRVGKKYGRPLKDKAKTVKSLKNILFELRGKKCERCGYDNFNILNLHHKIRKADGGSNELDNLELLCPNCHAEEHYNKGINGNQSKF